jgi:hypothetical protein
MYTIYLFKEIIEDNIYDVKLPISKINDFFEKCDFQQNHNIKEYWNNNVCITFSDKYGSKFRYITDIKITYDIKQKLLYQEFDEKECSPYQFSNVDLEETYQLYENKTCDYHLKLKKYDDYFIFEITTNDLNKLKNINNFLYLI